MAPEGNPSMARKVTKKKMGRPPKPANERRVVVSFSAPPELAAWLDAECERRGMGRSEFLKGLIERERGA